MLRYIRLVKDGSHYDLLYWKLKDLEREVLVMKISLPYDKRTMSAEIADKNVLAVLESKAASYKAEKSQEELVEASLDNPIGSPRLEDLVKDKKKITIISSDHTRPVPSHITMPILLRRIDRKSVV